MVEMTDKCAWLDAPTPRRRRERRGGLCVPAPAFTSHLDHELSVVDAHRQLRALIEAAHSLTRLPFGPPLHAIPRATIHTGCVTSRTILFWRRSSPTTRKPPNFSPLNQPASLHHASPARTELSFRLYYIPPPSPLCLPSFLLSTMVFFKRRSRANSYIENEAPQRSQSYDEYEKQRPDSSHTQQQSQHQVSSPTEEMYARPQQPQEPPYSRGMPNGINAASLGQPTPPLSSGMKAEPMPDLLTQAFNQAVRPYTEKIEQLESQLADMQAWVEQLEQQRAEVHSWIDKRGLRPGRPTVLYLHHLC